MNVLVAIRRTDKILCTFCLYAALQHKALDTFISTWVYGNYLLTHSNQPFVVYFHSVYKVVLLIDIKFSNIFYLVAVIFYYQILTTK